ncbi:hypothetical protein SUGI_1047260 [Cryptomeria japonica]|nr:hypothetical protein SUGI_1047260 [Cryptomeria japonica]
MIDGDTPCLGMLYESMDQCKESIQKALNNEEAEYMQIWETVDCRWKMMHTLLHAAACFLEPKLLSIDRRGDNEIMVGLYQAISRYVPDLEIAILIRDQSWQCKRGEGMFGGVEAKYDSPRMPGYRWWIAYGSSAPELQEFAIRILSQGASSSAYERNWSCFDHIHSKKRNKLLTGKLGDLVYVRSNLKLLMNKSAKNTSLGQTLEGIAMPDGNEPDFVDDELSSDTYDDDLSSQPSALDDLELF